MPVNGKGMFLRPSTPQLSALFTSSLTTCCDRVVTPMYWAFLTSVCGGLIVSPWGIFKVGLNLERFPHFPGPPLKPLNTHGTRDALRFLAKESRAQQGFSVRYTATCEQIPPVPLQLCACTKLGIISVRSVVCKLGINVSFLPVRILLLTAWGEVSMPFQL